MVSRRSDNKDENGRFLPPWKEIKIINIFGFKRRLAVGEKATVIPLDTDISPLDLRIIKAEKVENPCNKRMPGVWEVELEPITQKKFFEIEPLLNRADEYPFDVALIYPAVKAARQLKKDQLTNAMLPKGIAINSVKAALDLTGDGKPEVVILEYCCDNPSKPVTECDYTCGKTFTKVKNTWKLIDTYTPC